MEKLTQEQRERIAQNRELALQRLAERKKRLEAESSTQNFNKSSLNCNLSQVSSNIVKPPTNPPFFKSIVSKPNSFNVLPQQNTSVYKPTIKINFTIITFSPFHIAIVDLIKTLPTRLYNDKEKYWSISFSDYHTIVNRLKYLKDVKAEVEELPQSVKTIFQDNICGRSTVSTTQVTLNGIEENIINTLFPYQKLGVMFGIEKGGRVIIADEMGLGKSIQALAIAQKYNVEWPLLIVCPSSVKYAWKNQIIKFLPNYTDIYTIEKSSDFLPKSRSTSVIVIMSYDQMVIRLKELLNHSFYVIIFDESHFLKEMKAKRTMAALDLSKKATRVILLSGTPALSRPIELFSQLKIVNPSIFPYYQAFGLRYCDGRKGRFGFEFKGATNTEELASILEKTVMIRRLKKDVLDDLPAKRREIIYLSGTSIDHRMKKLQEARDAFNLSNKSINAADKHESLMRYYVETGIVKAQSVAEHIVESYFYEGAERRKILIFAHHAVVLDTITMMVARKGIKFIRIDGGTPQKERGHLCDEFQSKPDVLVAVLSITAAGVGITLTAASTVIFAELHWNPGCMLQAEDRAHRVGQKDSVLVQYMLAKNTADDDIWPLIEKKLKMLGSVNLSSDSYKDAENLHRDCSDRAITNYFSRPTNKNNCENVEKIMLPKNFDILDSDKENISFDSTKIVENKTAISCIEYNDDENGNEILIDEVIPGPSEKRNKM